MKAFLINDRYLPIYGIEDDCLISKEKGCLSYGFKVRYPAIYHKNEGDIESMASVLDNIFGVLVKDYVIHKQDYFVKSGDYDPIPNTNESTLQRYNRIHFNGRKVREQLSYIYITKVPEKYIGYDSSHTNRFLRKGKDKMFSAAVDSKYISKGELETFFEKRESVIKLLESPFFGSTILTHENYLGSNKKPGVFQLFKDFDLSGNNRDKSFEGNTVHIGERRLRFYTLQNNEQLSDGLDSCANSIEKQWPGRTIDKSLISSLGLEMDTDHVLNQYFYVPDQQSALEEVKKKQNRLYNYTHWLKPSGGKDRPEQKGESLDSSNNKLFIQESKEFIAEVVGDSKKIIFAHVNVGLLDGKYEKDPNFQLQLKENTADRHDLYFACCPGNAVGLPADLYMPLTSGAALSLAYFEDHSRGNAPFGQRVIDISSGRPLYWDFFQTPKRNKIITNMNAWGVGKTGSGKSYTWNSVLNHQYEMGHHIFNIDGSSSFERSTKYHNGAFFKVSTYEKIGFNPFLITGSAKDELDSKRKFLAYFLNNLLDSGNGDYANELMFGVFSATAAAYYSTVNHNHCFDTFYDFFREFAPAYAKDNGIEKSIKLSEILFLLREYYKGGVYDYLLNNRDERLKDLLHQRYITFQIKELKDDPKLFTNTTFLLTNLYKDKLYHPDLLEKIKFLHYDESWTAMDKPILAKFILDTIKTVRSQNGSTIFTSQDIEDFFRSEIIKNTVINNSDIGMVSDLSTYKGKPEYIRDILGLTDSNVNKIFGLNRNMPEGINAREIAVIYAKEHLHTFGIETSREEAAIFESDPDKKAVLKKIDIGYNELKQTAKHFAGN